MIQKIKTYNDYFVKFLFAAKNNEHHTIAFINAVLSHGGGPNIESIQIENPFNLKENYLDKETIVDVKCKADNGEIFLIEIQVLKEKKYQNRAIYYWAKNYANQLEGGQKYHILRPVIGIHVLNFTQFSGHQDIHSVFLLRDTRHDSTLTNHMALHFLEVPKARSYKAASKLLNWLKYFGNANMSDENFEDLLNEDEDISAAYETYKKFLNNPKLRDAAIRRQMFLSDQASREHDAREEGIEKGIEKTLREIVAIMLNNGKKIKEIAKDTGKTEKEIADLVKGIEPNKKS